MQKINTISDKIIHVGFALLALIVPLLLTPVNYELFEFNKMIAVYGITALIAGAWVSKMIAQKRIYVAKTPFDIPILLFVISQLASTLFSIDPHVSWFGYYSRFNGGMMSVFCYAILFYAFVSNIKRADLTKLATFTFTTACIVSFYGALEHFGIDKRLWVQDVQSRVFSTLGQPNWLAAYVVALIPITLSLAFMKKTYWPRAIFPAGCTLLFFLTLLYTRSRSGLIALGVVDILFWVVAGITTKANKGFRTALVLSHIAFAILFFFTGINIPSIDRYTTFTGWQQQLTKAKQEATQSATQKTPQEAEAVTGPVLETGGTESGVIRKYVWQGAINAWRSSTKTMLIGTGTETFAFAFYQNKPVGHNLTSEWDFLYNKAHNEYLNYLATTGVFGFGAYCSFLIVVFIWTIKRIIAKKDQAMLFVGILLGWLSILITNFFGFSVVVIQLLLFLLPASIYLLGIEEKQEKKKQSISAPTREATLSLTPMWQTVFLVSITILTVILIGVVAITWIADQTFAKGYRLEHAGQYAPSYGYLATAVAMKPNEPLYHDEFANTLSTLAIAAMDNQDATLASTLAQYAIAENEKAIAISPNNVNFWKSRTKIYYSLSTLDETMVQPAIQSLVQAERLSPADPKIAYNLAILSGRLNDGTQAITYLQHAIALKPDYRDAYYALFVFYQDMKKPDDAKAIIMKYLTTVNSQDEEFKKLVE